MWYNIKNGIYTVYGFKEEINMLTAFGKLCKGIRVQNDEFLADMADKLKVSPAFLSAVENGKKNVPQGFCSKIKEVYDLNAEFYEKLVVAAEDSIKQLKLSMNGLSVNDRDLVLSFARGFENLDDKEKEKIRKILKG